MTQATGLNLPLTTAAIESAVRQQEPRALLVPTWVVQKIITLDRGPLAALGTARVPAWMIARDRLLQLDHDHELDLEDVPEADQVLVLARPEPELIDSAPAPMELLRYWRMLFHARARGMALASLNREHESAALRRRIEAIGPATFNEARFVLQRDRYLPYAANDAEAYAQFAALFLELVYFRPEVLKAYFPSISDPQAIVRILSADVDGEKLLDSTHLPGAAGPVILPDESHPAPARPTGRRRQSRRDARRREVFLERARRADAVGNDVRAALLRMRLCRAGGESSAGVFSEALRDIDQLVARLQKAVGLDDATTRRWRAWLAELLENAAIGWWNAEGRLLYDLQKVCVYHEREIYSVGVIEWLVEFCRRPLRRPQPEQRIVLMIKSLRSALRRSARVRLRPDGRNELQNLIRGSIELLAERLRRELRPRVDEALEAARIVPADPTENIARDKLGEELIDSIAERGYLSFGQVRDAISRNQMKLQDLARPGDLLRGDQLLKLDSELENRLDALYHSGEIYLRLFHRLSSVLFATGVGRFITRALLLPFGGAFLILEALDHSVGKLILHISESKAAAAAAAQATVEALAMTPTTAQWPRPEHKAIFNQWWLLVVLGVMMLGLINSAPFRSLASRTLRWVGKGLRAVFVTLPRWIADRPLVRRIFNSRAMRLAGRYAIKPAIAALSSLLFIPPTVAGHTRLMIMAGVFLGINLVLSSRIGRMLEQAVVHNVRTTLARLAWEILTALVRVIAQLFENILEAIDRLLYAVDELLRFRAGQGKFKLILKAVLGIFWFYIAYITRFVINLLVEPQINPIKHFPVVTVSHKMLLPTIPYMGGALMTFGISAATAYPAATAIITSIPGIFGFLAWEFKENWKIYRANRPRNLRPLRMGSHGENFAQLLRPGFHSGTIPKLFYRLRKASLANSAKVARHQQALEHVYHSLELFFERELIALLNRHPLFAPTPLQIRRVELSVTRIAADLVVASPAGEGSNGNGSPAGNLNGSGPMTLGFEQRGGWVIASVENPGFLAGLAAPARQLFSSALLGFYKMSGVDLAAERLLKTFAPAEIRFDFRGHSLLVWPIDDPRVEVTYNLANEGPIRPQVHPADCALSFPTIDREALLLRRIQVDRRDWIRLWNPPVSPDPAGQTTPAAAESAQP